MYRWHKKDRNKRGCRGEVRAVCGFHTQGSIAPYPYIWYTPNTPTGEALRYVTTIGSVSTAQVPEV